MTVTITLEELRNYQVAMQSWATNNAILESAKSASSNASIMESPFRNPIVNIRDAVEKWMTENPMPKIVPKELEA